jgi:hypothetical protein
MKQKQAPRHHYTEEEIEFLKRTVPGRSYTEIIRLFNERFDIELTRNQIRGKMGLLGINNGRGYGLFENNRFAKGHKSLSSRPLGSERMNSGYVEIKFAEPKTWKRKHTYLWEEAHGPVPKGHTVIFADGNKTNFDLDNLLLVSRNELAVMNHEGLISHGGELTKVGKTIAELKLLINRKTRGAASQRQEDTDGQSGESADDGGGNSAETA